MKKWNFDMNASPIVIITVLKKKRLAPLCYPDQLYLIIYFTSRLNSRMTQFYWLKTKCRLIHALQVLIDKMMKIGLVCREKQLRGAELWWLFIVHHFWDMLHRLRFIWPQPHCWLFQGNGKHLIVLSEVRWLLLSLWKFLQDQRLSHALIKGVLWDSY